MEYTTFFITFVCKKMNIMRRLSLALLSAILFIACTSKEQKIEGSALPAVDTIPAMVMQIKKCSRLYTTEYKIRRIITHSDRKQITGQVMKRKFSIDIPIGERVIAIPVNATVKAYVDLGQVTADNIRKEGDRIEIILPDPQILMTSTRIDHDETKQYVALLRSNFTDKELTLYQKQGRDSIINDIPKLNIIDNARVNSARTIMPIIQQMGYKTENITITFRKQFTPHDIPKLLKNGEI